MCKKLCENVILLFTRDIFNRCAIAMWHLLLTVFTINPLREAADFGCGPSCDLMIGQLSVSKWISVIHWTLDTHRAHPHTVWMHKEANSAEGYLWKLWCYSFLGADLLASCENKAICSRIKIHSCPCVLSHYFSICIRAKKGFSLAPYVYNLWLVSAP